MQQTSNDWFAEKLVELNKVKIALTSNDIINLSKEANEIHKKQIVNACYYGSQNLPYEVEDKSVEYYNKMFESEKNENGN